MKSVYRRLVISVVLVLAASFAVSKGDAQTPTGASRPDSSAPDHSRKSMRELELELDIKRLELEIERRKRAPESEAKGTQPSPVSTPREAALAQPARTRLVTPSQDSIISEPAKTSVASAPVDLRVNEPTRAIVVPPASDPPLVKSELFTRIPGTAQPQIGDPKCAQVALNRANSSEFDRNLCDAVDLIVADGMLDLTGVKKELAVLYLYSAQKNEAIKNLILEFEKTRTDKQVGSDANSKGTTSLVVKGSAPQVIGWAVESGAATSSVSGTTVTIRANPVGLLNGLGGQGFVGDFRKKLVREDDSFARTLKKLSLGVSFDMGRGTETPVFLANQQQLSAVSVRYELINRRNPLRPAYQGKWNAFFASQINNLTSQVDAVNALIDANTETYTNTDLKVWFDETNRLIAGSPRNTDGSINATKAREILEEQLKKLPIDKLLEEPVFKNSLLALGQAGVSYSTARQDFLETLNKGTIVTLEYTNNREPVAPDTSNLRFIAEKGFSVGGGIMDVTFNASLTLYNKKPVHLGVRRLRDFQFALQLDRPLEDAFGLGDSVLSFAGKYERINGDVVDTFGNVRPGSRGDIALGQVKLTIPIRDWGIRLPLSLSFANRTELIREATVRGNFGVTFDLDPIFARFKPF